MPVTAHCLDCSDEHDLGERIQVPGTTQCPSCGSTSYRSIPIETDQSITKELDPEVLSNVDGVGNTVSESIVTKYRTVDSLQQAGVEDLCDIDHVGPTVAKRVVEATQ